MELSYEEIEKMFAERFSQYPEVGALVSSASFKEKLARIIDGEGVPADLFPRIEFEVKLVLAFFTPLRDLTANISAGTGISIEKSEDLVTMISAILFQPVYDELLAFDYLWYRELAKESALPEANPVLKERLELRPEGVQPPVPAAPSTPTGGNAVKPLTREELMHALAAKRTMQTDIAAVRGTDTTGAPVVGYDAYRANENNQTPPGRAG